MKYSTFAADVLCHGAPFACKVAAQCGVPLATMAKWLNRMALRPRAQTGQFPTVGKAA